MSAIASRRVSALRTVLFAAAVALVAAALPQRAAHASGGPWIAAYATEPTLDSVLTLPRGDFFNGLTEMAGLPHPAITHEHCGEGGLLRMNPRPVTDEGSPEATTLERDVADLREALAKSGVLDEKAKLLIEAYSNARSALFESIMAEQRPGAYKLNDHGNWVRDLVGAPPRTITWQEEQLAALPREFALYLAGARLWWQGEHNHDTQAEAVVQWQALLDLPPAERHYRSVWAAHMIARSTLARGEGEDCMTFHAAQSTTVTRTAAERVRQLAADGFADSMGLAAEASGILGRMDYDEGRPVDTIHHYYDMLRESRTSRQRASAMISLRFTITHFGWTSAEAAADPLARDIISLWIASERQAAPDWLDLVRKANRELPAKAAETLAWVAYNSGDFAYARELVRMAGSETPRARWVAAKLLLYDGQIDEGTRLLASVGNALPPRTPIDGPEYNMGLGTNGGYADGERGLLLLGRGDYAGALDAFVRAHSWGDVAYLVERVLTPRETERYLADHADAPYLHVSADQPSLGGGADGPFEKETEPTMDQAVHYILARRLVRDGQYERARPHMPETWRPFLDAYAKNRAAAGDASQPRRTRALHYFAAAWIARYRGMEIMGAEMEPDWTLYEGHYDDKGPANNRIPPDTVAHQESDDWYDAGAALRPNPAAAAKHWPGASPRLSAALRPSQDELDRVAASAPEPPHRFHYRTLAADLGWKAARLLPDNDASLAFILWQSGSWIQEHDDQGADKFYQALVSRCHQLPISAEADRLRWFPHDDKAPVMPDEIAAMVDRKLAMDRSR